ncbi:hypothetical protein [Paracidovorax wautersii]|uniref:Uncharacterized protein n=1 Tax=Paracidovorax wautersii TaxID=1177982 RepID=A0A1I2E714_9BURK|nr:hypothetical protein [Paracidovorax wautersii]SFE88764.1 hypothetical protein SAMN04489711_106277 [Paracidovorax wautersii]
MSIKFVISKLVTFRVSGQINDAEGVPQPFDFALTCERLAQPELDALQAARSDMPLADFFAGPRLDAQGQPVLDGVGQPVPFTHGWKDVQDDAGEPLPFTQGRLRELLAIPGMALCAFFAYRNECGAKQKN